MINPELIFSHMSQYLLILMSEMQIKVNSRMHCDCLLTSVDFTVDHSLSTPPPHFICNVSLSTPSSHPGPKTQALFNLQVRVGELPQLRQSKHRFNAFLLGLLKYVLALNPLWSSSYAWKVLCINH